MFLAYLNDITEIPGSPELIMYADDTNIFFTAETKKKLEEYVNAYLLKLSQWLNQNRLSLNTNKTKYIIFKPISKRDTTNVQVVFNGNVLEEVTEQKFLGIWFTDNLSWNAHVNKLKADLSKAIGSMYKIYSVLPTWLKQSLYYSLFYSKLSYGILLWGTTTACNYDRLIILQKKVLRMCENYRGDRRELRTQPLFNKYNILKADQIYYFKLLQWIQKSGIYNKPPDDGSRAYNIRYPKHRLPATRTNYGRQTLHFQTLSMLNRSDICIDFNQSFQNFKGACRRFLVENSVVYSPA